MGQVLEMTGYELSRREVQALIMLLGGRGYWDLTDDQVQNLMDTWEVTPERVHQIISRMQSRLRGLA